MNPEGNLALEEAEELVEVSTDVPYNTDDEFIRDLLMEQQEQM